MRSTALLVLASGAHATAPAGYKHIPGVLGYVGCFKDVVTNRQFSVVRGRAGDGRGLFVRTCADRCSQYQYFAIQDSQPRGGSQRMRCSTKQCTGPNDIPGRVADCYCSNSPDLSGNGAFEQLPEDRCAPTQCFAKGDEVAQHPCGGRDSNAVYKRFDLPDKVESYVGCYRDRSNAPGNTPQFETVTGRNGAGGLSVRQCAETCSGQGFRYFAIQDSEPRICSDRQTCSSEGKKQVCSCGNTPDIGDSARGNSDREGSAYVKLEDQDIGADTSCPSSTCFSRADREPCRNGVGNDACNTAGAPVTQATEQTQNLPDGGSNRPCGVFGNNAVYKLAVEPNVAGDPFTTYQGKKVQFYLPVGEEAPLLTCGSYELIGRVISSGVPGDAQQWFDKFRVRVAGKEAVVVDMADTAALLPSADSTSSAAADTAEDTDVSVPSAERRIQMALEQARRANTTGSGQKLTTLRVVVDGTAVPATGSLVTSTTRVWYGESSTRTVNVTVTRDAARQIGTGFVEILDVTSGDVSMQVQSSVASKFASEVDRIKKMHMDLAFTSLNAETCTGVLPEVWGVKPMSQQTARLLEPQQ